MIKREVQERDFRRPEFLDSDPKDYEFRDDGKVVRKDRWETAINSIRHALGDHRREFEIVEIENAVIALVNTVPLPPEDDAPDTWRSGMGRTTSGAIGQP